MQGLLVTLMLSLFFIIGILIPKFLKKTENLMLFSTSLAFIIMIYLVFFDLLPEIIEIFSPLSIINIIKITLFISLGMILLKVLDLFIPEHHHDHKEIDDNVKEHDSHLFHIGFITSVALIIHNILEGISIYAISLNDLKLGIIMAISVGMHNLPLGMEISLSMGSDKNKTKFKNIIIILLIISNFIGALILILLNKGLNETIEGLLLSLTVGLLLYITIFELLKEIIENFFKNPVKIGIVFGLVIAIVLFII